MSASVRARRPASPPLTTPPIGQPLFSPPPPPKYTPYVREDHLDADAKRAAASRGLGPGSGRMKHHHHQHQYPPGGFDITSGEWKLLFFVVLLATGVRLFRLSKPNSVVFDEVHFGKFASKYIKSQYYVDVHPPLAKLLITLAGFVFGYNGHFDFSEIGKVYENVPYVAMRLLPAILGVATVPLSYLTLRGLDCRATTALLASLFITFENGMITQSRHILLDSPLIFFTALTVFFWTGFCNEDKYESFTSSWWTWLTLSGLSLGAVVSCKWVGLFTIATIGFSTVYQLWNLLGDMRVPPRVFVRHFMARALCLIVVPVVFYMFMFELHFLILSNPGDGDGFMSSAFQHTLRGKSMGDTFADVAIGSRVTIRHVNTQGGYLHSHPHTYPGGSKQQQVTLYPHQDSNNDWRIVNATGDSEMNLDWANIPISYITPGSRIKLRHIATEKHLHSHDIRPPVSDVDFQNEVSAYGMAGFAGDLNDEWYLEIDHGDKRDSESYKRLRTLRTTFKLRHALTGCYLFSHKVKLPEWGFEQQEVTCNKNAVRENSLWYVETAKHEAFPLDAPKVNYKLPGFFGKFFELQRVMWTTNAGLTDRHTYDSRPDSWPRLRRGINFWVKDHRQIYLIGNPLVWWLSTMSVVAYVAVRGFLILRAKRGYRDFDNTKVVKYDSLCGFLFIGWSLHYFPFFLMGRQLFLHHYFPALYFAILLSCAVFDLLTSMLRPKVRLQVAAVLILLAVWHYQHFAPLAYGGTWTRAECESAKWLKTWDFACNEFYEQYGMYDTVGMATPVSTTGLATIGGEPGGRAAVVVDEEALKGAVGAGQQQQQQQQPEQQHTSTLIGEKAEPGRDVFNQPKKAKSEGVVKENDGDDGGVEKVVSAITQPQTQPMQAHGKEKERGGPVGVDGDRQTGGGGGDVTTTTEKNGSEEDKEGGGGKLPPVVQGPLGEAQAEAEKVAQELYPDAA
ncbi:glycosyltransferase family 39 protein [Amanita thiersii Skay4041]|uniref:Dolichyl-phosphate-mannose--protein mannosyltransferase n=1 Tax=Amanita thiersii Skay4041 TaxID=703135 RepID=A0A2A9NG54_9AGAR|nr:glycosyltransferase family 39 protein [Amanita thiersii Skay4041]